MLILTFILHVGEACNELDKLGPLDEGVLLKGIFRLISNGCFAQIEGLNNLALINVRNLTIQNKYDLIQGGEFRNEDFDQVPLLSPTFHFC